MEPRFVIVLERHRLLDRGFFLDPLQPTLVAPRSLVLIETGLPLEVCRVAQDLAVMNGQGVPPIFIKKVLYSFNFAFITPIKFNN